MNQLARDAKSEVSKVEAKLDQYRKDAANQLDKTAKDVQSGANSAIDKFDKNVTEVSEKVFCRPGLDGHKWAGGDETERG